MKLQLLIYISILALFLSSCEKDKSFPASSESTELENVLKSVKIGDGYLIFNSAEDLANNIELFRNRSDEFTKFYNNHFEDAFLSLEESESKSNSLEVDEDPVLSSKVLRLLFNENSAIGIGDEIYVLSQTHVHKMTPNQYANYVKSSKLTASIETYEIIKESLAVTGHDNDNARINRVCRSEWVNNRRVKGVLLTTAIPIVPPLINLYEFRAGTHHQRQGILQGEKTTISHSGLVTYEKINIGIGSANSFTVDITDNCTNCRRLSTVLDICGGLQCIGFRLNTASTTHNADTHSCDIIQE